ncbi:peroxisomal membrane protein 11A [Sceloporus undulatus]|uniref:peroxisomal membrane protein 11A n=1 Tax=Sceloporus undulatus TaxID=8520 RepID=UPI001C4C1475|nr:peroxisomal membrane protein 11A [Sceloporus undulatus]
MEAFVRFSNQTQGRERIFRATQYSCMLLSYMLEHKPGQEQVVMKLKRLESNMSSGRKLFRLGNTVHAIVAARQATQLPDIIPRFCLIASNLNRALYFICDTVLWVKSVGIFSDIDKKKWRNWATRCYYYSLMVNLAEDMYQLCWRMEHMARTQKPEEDSSPCQHDADDGLLPFLLFLYLTLRKHPPLLLDTVKNLCDLSSPLDRLGIYKANPGIIGLCGLISSLVGILTVARPHLKLKH